MFKYIGIILIVLCGVVAGLYFYFKLSERVKSLEGVTRMISHISTQIRYTNASVSSLLKELNTEDFNGLNFVKNLVLLLEAGDISQEEQTSPQMVWEKAVGDFAKLDAFSKKDIELLIRFGKGIGKSDLDGQQKHMEIFKDFFNNQLLEAKEQLGSKGKLYVSLGILGGLSTALLFI